jgi:hypothetical protein
MGWSGSAHLACMTRWAMRDPGGTQDGTQDALRMFESAGIAHPGCFLAHTLFDSNEFNAPQHIFRIAHGSPMIMISKLYLGAP